VALSCGIDDTLMQFTLHASLVALELNYLDAADEGMWRGAAEGPDSPFCGLDQ
jgi:hypothetical protein